MSSGVPIVLASTSPRRQFLLREAGFRFTVEKPAVDESFPDTLPAEQVASFLAAKKSETFRARVRNEIVITSDTVVILDKRILNKPLNQGEAIEMLSSLSGRTHLVVTSVCILYKGKEEILEERTRVTFKPLMVHEIARYVDLYRPYDKAGAYGAQEFLAPGFNPCSKEEIAFLQKIGKTDLIAKSISAKAGAGMAGIEKIDGSYFNVMGFPIHIVYERLMRFQGLTGQPE